MKLFIDCEWNDWKGSLISMALVPESKEFPPFYEVMNCYADVRPWVTHNVMGVLEKDSVLRTEFLEILNQFLLQFDEIEIIADWPEDIMHFCREIVHGPGKRIGPDRMTFVVDRACGSDKSVTPHNALADAEAIRDSYLENRD